MRCNWPEKVSCRKQHRQRAADVPHSASVLAPASSLKSVECKHTKGKAWHRVAESHHERITYYSAVLVIFVTIITATRRNQKGALAKRPRQADFTGGCDCQDPYAASQGPRGLQRWRQGQSKTHQRLGPGGAKVSGSCKYRKFPCDCCHLLLILFDHFTWKNIYSYI